MRWSGSSFSGVSGLGVDWACEPGGRSIKLKRSVATARCPDDGLNMLAPLRLSMAGISKTGLSMTGYRFPGVRVNNPMPVRSECKICGSLSAFGNTGSDGKLLRAVENCSVPAPFAAMAQWVVGGGYRDAMGRDFISEGLPSGLEEDVKIPQIQVQLPEKP